MLRPISLPILLLSLPFSLSQSVPPSNCTKAPGVHIIVTRASTEPPGTGIMGVVAAGVAAQLPGSDVAAVPYPALLQPYVSSETQGIGNLTQMVTAYTASCPQSGIVLMGYSQGAQVTADFLCGASETGFPQSKAMADVARINNNVLAAVLFGDPSFVKGQPWDAGTASNVSYFPRLNNAGCAPAAHKMLSVCNKADFFCDSGGNLTVHLSYVQTNGPQAVAFAVQKVMAVGGRVRNATVVTNGTTSTGSSTNATKTGAGATKTAAATGKPTTTGVAINAGSGRLYEAGWGVLALGMAICIMLG